MTPLRMRLIGLSCILGGSSLLFFGVFALMMTEEWGSGICVAGFIFFFAGLVAIMHAATLIARIPTSDGLFCASGEKQEQISALERSTLEFRELSLGELPLMVRISRVGLVALGCIMMGLALGEMNNLLPPLVIRGTAAAVTVPTWICVFVEVAISLSLFGIARVLRWGFVDRLEEAVKRGLTPVH